MPKPFRRRWFQIRLGTVFILMVIIGLCVGQFAASRRALELESRNGELEAMNSQLRAEAGYLERNEPNKVAVLRIRDLDDLSWQWKIWLPPGKWFLGGMTEGIPSQGVPGGSSVGPVEGDREVLAYATVRKGPDGNWRFRAGVDSMQIGNALDASNWLIKHADDAAPKSAQTVEIAGDKAQSSFDASQPVVLMRLRAHEIVAAQNGGWQSKDNPKNSDGIMVWLHQ